MVTAGANTASDFSSYPMELRGPTVPSQVMLAMSNDHQLFFKAYTDFNDLNGDLIPDTTYVNEIEYSGYFDSSLCYEYDGNVFRAKANAVLESIATPPDASDAVEARNKELIRENYYCNLGATGELWSGNFLNWATMTRIDVVRKVLFGGFRSVDTVSTTVLERSYLPNDAHSFAKYYSGDDLSKLTPFAGVDDITLCNTTFDSSGAVSHASAAPPLLRVVEGNFSLWAANQRWQCLYDGTGNNPANNSEFPHYTRGGFFSGWSSRQNAYDEGDENSYDSRSYPLLKNAHHKSPTKNNRPAGFDYDFIVRVEVCGGDASLREENCEFFTNANGDAIFKPTGILQDRGLDGQVHWGLMSGSYKKNLSGGVLRKNISNIVDEIVTEGTADNPIITGIFKNQNPLSAADAPAKGGIVSAINSFRIVDWVFGSNGGNDQSRGTYIPRDNCKWGEPGFDEADCKNWGNPFSAIMYESYRYFSGAGATVTVPGSNDILPHLNSVAWESTLSDDNYCANLNVIGFNASTVSYDPASLDNVSSFSGGSASPASGDAVSKNAADITRDIGQDSGLYDGADYFIPDASNENLTCTSSGISDLSAVSGTCPNAPRLQGSYSVAGLAQLARFADINPDVKNSQLVKTYGVSLAPALPQVEFFPPGSSKPVTIIPACQRDGKDDGNLGNNDGTDTNCALVDFKILKFPEYDFERDESGQVIPKAITDPDGKIRGAFYVNWEDSEEGGDFDQDMNGVIRFTADENSVLVESKVYAETTGAELGFGFVIGGVDSVQSIYRPMGGSNDILMAAANAGRNIVPEGFHAVSGANHFEAGECPPARNFNAGRNGGNDPKGTKGGCVAYKEAGNEATGWGDANPVSNASNSPTDILATELRGNKQGDDFLRNQGLVDDGWGRIEFGYSGEGSGTQTLQQPLWFASKYGGPRAPDLLTGAEELYVPYSNDTVDNYFEVTNPKRLENGLNKIIDDILANATRGSATGTVSSSAGVGGITIQSYYDPKLVSGNEQVTWVGSLNAFFKDEYGFTREDTVQDGVLTDADRVVSVGVIVDQDGKEKYEVRKFDIDNALANGFDNPDSVGGIETLRPLWSARDNLDDVADFTVQDGVYDGDTRNAVANRHIYTSIKTAGTDGLRATDYETEAGGAHLVPFTGAYFVDNNHVPLLDLADPDEAEDLINYIRGDIAHEVGQTAPAGNALRNYRPRSISFFKSNDNPGPSGTRWLLGDIVNSTPVIVGEPRDGYDRDFGDKSYRAFRKQNKDRPTVIYAGANDGMLHAFNGGNCSIEVIIGQDDKRRFSPRCDGTAAKPLGSELWAYVPFNALPHLKWLADNNYPHVAYVDGEVRAYDVQIFHGETRSDRYVQGWGTILVVGMRLGGAEYEVKAADGTVLETTRSAYIVLDVTDPELEPRLIAEITDPNLGFSTVKPDIVKKADANGNRRWYLAFGSGPIGDSASLQSKREAMFDFLSNQNAHVFLYDLADGVLAKKEVLGSDYGFVGGINSVDWGDFNDDSLYFGVVQGDPVNPGGNLFRLDFPDTATNATAMLSGSVQKVVNVGTRSFSDGVNTVNIGGKAFYQAPLAVVDSQFDRWLFASTGRMYSSKDIDNANTETEYFYGIKQDLLEISEDVFEFPTNVARSELLDVSDMQVMENGDVRSLTSNDKAPLVAGVAKNYHHRDLVERAINEGLPEDWDGDGAAAEDPRSGWYLEFTPPHRTDEKVVTPITRSISSVVFGTYRAQVAVDSCSSPGSSFIYQRDIRSGLVPTYSPLLDRGQSTTYTLNGTDVTTTPFKDKLETPHGGGGLTGPIDGDTLSGATSKGVDTAPQEFDVAKHNRRTSWREIPGDKLSR